MKSSELSRSNLYAGAAQVLDNLEVRKAQLDMKRRLEDHRTAIEKNKADHKRGYLRLKSVLRRGGVFESGELVEQAKLAGPA